MQRAQQAKVTAAALVMLATRLAAVAAAQARRVLRQVHPAPERVVQAVHQVLLVRPLPMLAVVGVATTIILEAAQAELEGLAVAA